MFFKDLWSKAMIGSLGIMAFVLLITSSIWLNYILKTGNDNGTVFAVGSWKGRATFALVGPILAILSVIGLSFEVHRSGWSKSLWFTFFILFIFCFICAAVPMHDENLLYKNYFSMKLAFIRAIQSSGIYMDPPNWFVNASNVFPVAITFLIVPGVTFIGTSIYVARDEVLF